MINARVLGAGLLLFLFMGKKGAPRGTVTIDEPNVRVVPKPKTPAKKPTLEQELAAPSEPAPKSAPAESLEAELSAPSSAPSSPAVSSPPAKPSAPILEVDRPKLFTPTSAELAAMKARAETFAAASQQSIPQQSLPSSQKEATPFRAPPPLPTVPAATKAPAPMLEVVYKPAAQQPYTNVSPTLQPKPQGPQIPAGYDPAKAKAGASAIASHLAKKGPASYSHDQLKIWQRHAALAQDGLYGGSTRGALIAFGVKDPPRAFFKPTATIPYVPPEQRV